MLKLVSVLIPARGELKYISPALESIWQNQVKPYEVVIVDDGIHEDSRHEIDSFKDKLNINLIKNSGEGLVDALNVGLNECQSDYIARLDCDDMMTPDRIGKQISFLEANHDVVVLGSQCVYVDELGKEIGISAYPIGKLNGLESFFKQCLICHPSTMFRRSDSQLIGGYRSIFKWNNVDIAEDYDLWLRISRKGIIWNTDECLTFYRQHQQQISSKANLGQLLGTPYISSVAALNLDNPTTINFTEFDSVNAQDYFEIVRLNYGIVTSIYIRTFIYLFKNLLPKSLIRSVVGRFFISRISVCTRK